MNYAIYPKPSQLAIGRPRLSRKSRKFIRLHQTHSDNFSEALRRFAMACQLEVSYGAKDEEVLIDLTQKSGFSREQYAVTTSKAGYHLTASEECGLFRGLSSLAQVLPGEDLPHLTIQDQPDFKHRGVMLDISRCKVPTLDTLKALIDQFAALKFNQLQLYTEHTFAFARHPSVWAEASPLTATDILHLKQYAAARYIDLVPNLNCFGHFERWLKHPEYHRYAECPEGFIHPLSGAAMPSGSTLAPSRRSLKLVDELHAEYLPLFDSEFFNVGGDEPWELGLGRSKAQCQEVGATQVYLDFMSDIQRLTEKRGRQMMFWSDIVLKDPACLKQLSKQLIAMNWGYEANHPFAQESEQVARQKIPFYVCPGTSSWNSLTGRTENMRRNIRSAAKQGKIFGAEGLLVTDWGDHGHHQYLPISYPGFVTAACEGWRQGSVTNKQLPEILNRFFLDESSQSGANRILELGDILSLVKSPLRNATVFNRLLFWQMQHEPKSTRHLDTQQLSATLKAFADWEERPKPNNPLVAAELENAANMAKHGIHRLAHFRELESWQGAGGLSKLRQEIAVIKGQHEALWLGRNRVGGLRESTDHLEQAAKPLFR